MAPGKNKFAYDREYYENLARRSFEGNAARKLDVVEPEYDEEPEFDEEEGLEYGEYAYRQGEVTYETANAANTEPVQKVKRSYGMGILLTTLATLAIGVLMLLMFSFVSLKVEISRAEKQLTKQEEMLSSIQTLNEYKAAELDIVPDRNYIYTVAVGRLGMVYPTDNNVVYYNPGDDGHVRQYAFVP